METKINLDQCRIEEITEEYRIQKLDTQGNLITESLPLYNLTAEEELNADIQVEKNGSLKIILTDRSWKEFQQMRVILAGVKNQEIYFENAVTAEKENELLLEIGHLVSELEHGRNKSRSRNELWTKGLTSGHLQYVKSLTLDCDNDTILAKVDQVGAACHTGNRTCFFKPLYQD